MRRIGGCEVCGEERELATKTPPRCFACYRREERERERRRTDRVVDRHNPGLRREHKKLIRAFSAVMAGLADLGVSREDLLAIRDLLRPYLDPVAPYLTGLPDGAQPVNGEHGSTAVHGSQADTLTPPASTDTTGR